MLGRSTLRRTWNPVGKLRRDGRKPSENEADGVFGMDRRILAMTSLLEGRSEGSRALIRVPTGTSAPGPAGRPVRKGGTNQ